MKKLSSILLVLVFMCILCSHAGATTYYFTQAFNGYGTLTGSFEVTPASPDYILVYTDTSKDPDVVAFDNIANFKISWAADAGSPVSSFNNAATSTSIDGSNYMAALLSISSGGSSYVWSDDKSIYVSEYGGPVPELLLGAFDTVEDNYYVKYLGGYDILYDGELYTGELMIWDPGSTGDADYKIFTKSALTATTSTGGGTSVPEPATLFLLGSGLIGLAGLRKKLKN